MRGIAALLFMLTWGPAAMVAQSGARGGAAASAAGACSLLTKDVLVAHSPQPKQNLTLMLSVPPQEDKVGGGTACSYGGVTFQLDVLAPATIDRLAAEWTAVPGVGDRAAFRENGREYAELGVRAGKRTVTVQMSVPTGRTPASIRDNAIGLAKALLAKLK